MYLAVKYNSIHFCIYNLIYIKNFWCAKLLCRFNQYQVKKSLFWLIFLIIFDSFLIVIDVCIQCIMLIEYWWNFAPSHDCLISKSEIQNFHN